VGSITGTFFPHRALSAFKNPLIIFNLEPVSGLKFEKAFLKFLVAL
jgi:hypothetical protein